MVTPLLSKAVYLAYLWITAIAAAPTDALGFLLPFLLALALSSGLDVLPFQLWKLHSMQVNAEASGAQCSGRGDPRITRIGGLLRGWLGRMSCRSCGLCCEAR